MPKFQNEQKPVKDILNVFAGSWVSNCIRKKMKATYKYSYFPVVFDGYRYRGDEVYEKLKQGNIFARKYFYPITSHFECYRGMFGETAVPVAGYMSERVLALPLYADLTRQ